jgi:hypothetical protein
MFDAFCLGYEASRTEFFADSDEIGSGMLAETRIEIPNLIEIVGEISSQLAEAIQDIDYNNNLIGGQIVADDALESLARLEAKVSEMGSNVAKWLAWSKGGEE